MKFLCYEINLQKKVKYDKVVFKWGLSMLNETDKKFYIQKIEKYKDLSDFFKKQIVTDIVCNSINALLISFLLINGHRGAAISFGSLLSIGILLLIRNIVKKAGFDKGINAIKELLQYHGVNLEEISKGKGK